LAFHPYPQLIRWLFNARRFGPPWGFTPTSPWPWIDHSVSRLPRRTARPFQTRFRCGSSAERINLARQAQLVGSLYKRHAVIPITLGTPTACKHTVSGTVSLAVSAFFSPFPHGTSSLSVMQMYLALADGAARFTQGFTGPALLRIPRHMEHNVRLQAFHLLWDCFPGSFVLCCQTLYRSYNPPSPVARVWAAPRSLATTWGITSCFLLLFLLRCFSSEGSPPGRNLPGYPNTSVGMGFPIRTSADHSFVAAPRSLSQLSTSFIATACQGIHRAPLSYFYLHGLHKSPPQPPGQPKSPASPASSPSQVFLLDYLSLIVTSLQLTTTTSKNRPGQLAPAGTACHHPGNPTPVPARPDPSRTAASWYHVTTGTRTRPPACKAGALANWLSGATGTRTPDPLLAKQVL
jgi:hypothetical protein